MIADRISDFRGAIGRSLKRFVALFPSASNTLKSFILHGTLISTIATIVVTMVVAIKQWHDQPIAIGPFTVVSGADTYGITAEALSDQLKGQISRINSEAGELFVSRKLVDNSQPLDIKLGNTGWTFATLTRAFGVRFTSAQIMGRVSKTGDFLVMQFTTSFGDHIQEERIEIPLPKAPLKAVVDNRLSEKPDETFLARIGKQIDCMALKVVAGVSRDVAANYLHKRDEATGYDPGIGPTGMTDACIHDDDVNLYSQVREDRSAEPYKRVNALIGLSVHYSQTRQSFEELNQAEGARTLALQMMPCEDDPALLSLGQRVKCTFHRTNKKNRVAQIASWMQLGAAYSDYANRAATIGEVSYNRSESEKAYAHVHAIDRQYAPGADALGLQFSFENRYDDAIAEFLQSLDVSETAPVHMDYGIARILGRNAVFTDRAVKKSNLDDAVSHFSAAVNLEPAYWDAHSQLGYALYLRGRYRDAADVLQVAAANDKSNRYLRRLLASVLGDLCRFDEARAVFGSAYKENARDDEHNDPASHHSSAVIHNPDALDVLSDWGKALDGFGFHEAALEQETAVIKLDSQNVSARVFRGSMRIASAGDNQKQVDDAVTDFKMAFESDVTRSEFVLESYLLGLLKGGRVAKLVDLYREWAASGLVPLPATQPREDRSSLPPNQRLRALYAKALAASGHDLEAQMEMELLSTINDKPTADAVASSPLAGLTVGDEDKQVSHSCRMGAWRRSPQLSEVAITDLKPGT